MSGAAREYRSALRDEQARATRRRIVDAGAALFVERGYAPTTIDAIAERAGVSRRTVFTSVGGKTDVLRLAFEWALAGDDEPVPIGDRPAVRAFMQAGTPTGVLAPWLAMTAGINVRVAALYHVLVVAADGDPDVAGLLEVWSGQRVDGVRQVVRRVAELGGLRDDLTVDDAVAIADLLIDPLLHRRAVDVHGWDLDTATRHLQAVAASALLRPGRTARRR